jgi:hypothetical protein
VRRLLRPYAILYSIPLTALNISRNLAAILTEIAKKSAKILEKLELKVLGAMGAPNMMVKDRVSAAAAVPVCGN